MKFMFYYLFVVDEWCKSHTNVSGFASVDMKGLKAFEIPLPPLPIQSEIVKILDKFSALQAELEAELVYRKQQYEYYRDRLIVGSAFPLSEGTCHPHRDNETQNTNGIDKHVFNSPCSDNVKWMKMSEVGTFTRGKRFVRTDIVGEGVPCIHYGDMYTYYGLQATQARTYLTEEKASKMRFAKKNDVVIVGAGENNMDIGVGLAWLGDEDVAVHDACYIFKSNLNPRYVVHYLRTSQYHWALRKYVSEGKICSVSAAGIGQMMIPIPPLSEQTRIASILDKFEALTTSISEGLPAEIAARRQQYEHYRDKLLTFKKKVA